MVAEFSIWPIGGGESTSEQVAKIVRLVDESGIPYKLNAMSTVVEGEWDQIMGLISRCHQLIMKDMNRAIINITIDDRKGRTERITKKVESVERILGKAVSK